MSEFKFIQGEDYYLDNGKVIMTESYLKRRGTCCGSGCRHCVFWPMHTKGTKTLKESSEDKSDSN